MVEKISISDDLHEQLKSEDKIVILDKEEDLEAIFKMNEEMELIRRDYQMKEKESINSASKILLTA